MAWIDVFSLADLKANGNAVVRRDGRQILLLHNGMQVFACANRCPHEGYPLSEGTLSEGCVLTCHWHNWKFDLATGATLIGGDALTLYKVKLDRGRVLVDFTPADPALRREAILAGLSQALEDRDQARLVRETARLIKLGADPLDAIRHAVLWAADRLEFGTSHALGGANDWLELHACPATAADERLAALGEILGHLAEDADHGQRFPFPAGETAWSQSAFLGAIEREDQAGALAILRGGLAAGFTLDELLPAFIAAALAHYNDFGHSLIYTVKTAALARRLGPLVTPMLLFLLTRSLVHATREDLLPEFSSYGARLAAWSEPADGALPLAPASLLLAGSPKAAMRVVAGWSGRYDAERIFAVAVGAAAWQLLHVDEPFLTRTEGKFADNIGWLDFTHALTFAEAAHEAMRMTPELWPHVLLQLACFIGRNCAYPDANLDTRPFEVADIDGFFDESRRMLFDHGRDRFIVSVHLIKTLMAGAALTKVVPEHAPCLAAGLNRLVHARMKGRHVLRTARQMRGLVEQE
jgi:nitrite reductase/ring-hydroxylating ferredoxin subunit